MRVCAGARARPHARACGRACACIAVFERAHARARPACVHLKGRSICRRYLPRPGQPVSPAAAQRLTSRPLRHRFFAGPERTGPQQHIDSPGAVSGTTSASAGRQLIGRPAALRLAQDYAPQFAGRQAAVNLADPPLPDEAAASAAPAAEAARSPEAQSKGLLRRRRARNGCGCANGRGGGE